MRTIYLMNPNYAEKPTLPVGKWLSTNAFNTAIATSGWEQLAKASDAYNLCSQFDVLTIRVEVLQGYCFVHSVCTLDGTTAREYDRIDASMQRDQAKHEARQALYKSLLEHLLHN